MSVSSLVEHYGYWAVFVGTLLEGETILLFAGFAAHRGLLQLPQVVLLAFAASALADQLYFLAGHLYGEQLFGRFPALAAKVPRVRRLLARRQTPLILGVRFMYGLRVAGPIALGALGVRPLKFAVLNTIGAATWAVLITGIGYQFGNALEWLLRDIRRVEEWVLVGILAAGIVWWMIRGWRRRRRNP